MISDDVMPSTIRLDLNLLRVFNAIYQNRSILLASKQLNLSQSAVSHALSRLRESLSDELFIRTANGMEPSVRAQAISGPIKDALNLIYSAVGVETFDPATTSRTFTLAATDYVTSVLLSRVIKHLSTAAPGIKLVVRPSTRLDLTDQIDVGRIDLVLGTFADLPKRVQSVSLWQQRDVLVMRRDHPLLSNKQIILDHLAGQLWAVISVGGQEEGAVNGFISERGLARQSDMFDRQSLEHALASIGQTPRYALTLPHSLALPEVLADSDLVGIVPEPLAQAFQERFGLHYRPLPYPGQTSVLEAVWHAQKANDPGHIWLRNQLVTLSQQ
ncbi:LysR family transcriptional regulator [Pseudomonas sp. R76]|uniref:LysR family transcriptional regulator n=1 Tax=Pseudomonas sp. R76 TaxID=1573711 RepID=UPI00131FA915|nr:LysR family transcriptional regulator [Pseudomonas sp. R76]QHD06945.1 LysR family transcriptional regulator [Pseudomonas sp. R76]